MLKHHQAMQVCIIDIVNSVGHVYGNVDVGTVGHIGHVGNVVHAIMQLLTMLFQELILLLNMKFAAIAANQSQFAPFQCTLPFASATTPAVSRAHSSSSHVTPLPIGTAPRASPPSRQHHAPST